VTSSANLRLSPDAADQHDSVRDALVAVAEQSFFAWVDSLDAAGFAELAPTVDAWLRADVHFTGAFGGHMALVLPEALGRELLASCLGASPDETAATAATDLRLALNGQPVWLRLTFDGA
jgi:hypothetical protein